MRNYIAALVCGHPRPTGHGAGRPYLFGARDYGGAQENEYTFDLGLLAAGDHYLQLLYEDHGDTTGFIINATATPVPEPMTAAMLLAGLGLVGAFARRKACG